MSCDGQESLLKAGRDIPDNPSVNVRLAETEEVGRPGLTTDLASLPSTEHVRRNCS